MQYSYADLSKMVDHSLLNPSLTVDQLEAGVLLAKAYQCGSVCIMPYYMSRCTQLLEGSGVMPSTTIGFPHGGHTTRIKQLEAEQAVADGCRELDMVVNISKVLSEDWDYVRRDIQAVIQVAHAALRRVKVIFENCYLQDDHKKRLCAICTEVKADWVKTSTGYGSGGATLPDLQLMLDHVGPGVQVKAAGGIRDLDSLIQVKQMGVTRVGASRTAEILGEARQRLGLSAISSPSLSGAAGY
jgi:deoxyribose-phosphate aldolase